MLNIELIYFSSKQTVYRLRKFLLGLLGRKDKEMKKTDGYLEMSPYNFVLGVPLMKKNEPKS
jgi:hypothetical protein